VNKANSTKIDYSRKWWVLASIAMGVFLATIDGSIVNIALPTLVKSLETNFALVQWVVLGYLLTITTLLLGFGRLADMFGKKKLYVRGMAIFTIGSMLCGFSPSIGLLIASRIIQAVGGAMMMAIGTAIVTESFPDHERGKALGIQGAIVSIGIIAGPAIGGMILGALSWHWIFFVNLPVGLLGLVLVLRHVPNVRPAGNQRFDIYGAVSLFISVTAFLMALTVGQEKGFLNPTALIFLGTWIVFLVLFIGIQKKIEQPMIDLSLFSNKLFSINVITGFLAFLAVSGMVLIMPFYLENILNKDPQVAGFMLAVLPVSMGITAPLAGSLSDRVGTRLLTVIGLTIAVTGYIAISTLNENTTTWGYLLRFIPLGIGMGIFQSPNNSAIMGSAPKNRLGVASGLLAITRTLGQTSGISIFGAMWAARIMVHAGSAMEGDVTSAPAITQVLALRDVLLVLSGIILVGLCLCVYALIAERKTDRMTEHFTLAK
jgi:EmrB/QacA subfamily drug resistance transporter